MTTTRKRTRRPTRRETATVVANKLGLMYLTKRIHAAVAPFLRAALDAALDQARTCLAETAGRGSTPQERDVLRADPR